MYVLHKDSVLRWQLVLERRIVDQPIAKCHHSDRVVPSYELRTKLAGRLLSETSTDTSARQIYIYIYVFIHLFIAFCTALYCCNARPYPDTCLREAVQYLTLCRLVPCAIVRVAHYVRVIDLAQSKSLPNEALASRSSTKEGYCARQSSKYKRIIFPIMPSMIPLTQNARVELICVDRAWLSWLLVDDLGSQRFLNTRNQISRVRMSSTYQCTLGTGCPCSRPRYSA